MRIGFIADTNLAKPTGASQYARQLATHLRRQGAHVDLLKPEPVGPIGRLLGGGASVLNSVAFVRRLKKSPYDVLLHDVAGASGGWLHGWLPRGACPLVALVHGGYGRASGKGWVSQSIGESYLRTADAIIASSAHVRHHIARNVPDMRIRLVYPAWDHLPWPVDADSRRAEIEARISRAEQSAPLRLIGMGCLDEARGPAFIVQALAPLAGMPWRLDWYGDHDTDPHYVRELDKSIDQQGLAKHVTTHGVVDDVALASAYRASDAMISLSGGEGFPNACLEAMAFGLPVIANASGALQEIITHGRQGLLRSSESEDELVWGVRRFKNHRNLVISMGLEAHERAVAWPTWSDSAAAVCRLLQEVVAESRK